MSRMTLIRDLAEPGSRGRTEETMSERGDRWYARLFTWGDDPKSPGFQRRKKRDAQFALQILLWFVLPMLVVLIIGLIVIS
jgi:hypothetical protein